MTTVSPPSFNISSDPEKEQCLYLYDAVWRKTYLTDFTYRNLLAVTCIRIISAIPTFLLNAIIIFVVATRRRLQTNTNILLACLAGTDLLTALVAQPISIVVDIKRIRDIGPFCTLEKVFVLASSMLSFATTSHLVLISVDRYIAIKHSLRYQDIVTKQRLVFGVFLAWAVTVVLTAQEIAHAVTDSDTLYTKVKDVIVTFITVLCITVIIYTNCYIFSETRRQKKRIQTEQVTYEEAKRMKKDRKAANTLLIILAALALTYLPMTVGVLVMVSQNMTKPRVMILLWSWGSTCFMLGSLFNPVIYCWRIKKLRRAFLEILHFRQLENRSANIEMIQIQRHRPEIQISTCENISRMPQVNKNPFRSPSVIQTEAEAEEVYN